MKQAIDLSTPSRTYEQFEALDRYSLNQKCLERISESITDAMKAFPSVLAIRFDLRYPKVGNCQDIPPMHCEKDITKFIESLKAQIKAELRRKDIKFSSSCNGRLMIWSNRLVQPS